MSHKVGGGTVWRLHQVLEAIGLALMTAMVGAKRAGHEHLLSYRVATGGMIIGTVVSFTVTALGMAAGGVAARAAIGVGIGISFFGAFAGMLFGLLLHVSSPPPPSATFTREEAEQKKDMNSEESAN